MCNGASTRTSQGGSIAVLRATGHQRRSDKDAITLLFHNALALPGTSVELQGWVSSSSSSSSSATETARHRHWVVIQ
jgi:hypothetical protein